MVSVGARTRAAWHANTEIDNALPVTCPSLSSAVQHTLCSLRNCSVIRSNQATGETSRQAGCYASVHRALAPGSMAASNPSQFAAEPPTISASVGASDATRSMFGLDVHFNRPHVCGEGCECCVCCCTCGPDPYLQQRASPMKMLLRHTHTELALPVCHLLVFN